MRLSLLLMMYATLLAAGAARAVADPADPADAVDPVDVGDPSDSIDDVEPIDSAPAPRPFDVALKGFIESAEDGAGEISDTAIGLGGRVSAAKVAGAIGATAGSVVAATGGFGVAYVALSPRAEAIPWSVGVGMIGIVALTVVLPATGAFLATLLHHDLPTSLRSAVVVGTVSPVLGLTLASLGGTVGHFVATRWFNPGGLEVPPSLWTFMPIGAIAAGVVGIAAAGWIGGWAAELEEPIAGAP